MKKFLLGLLVGAVAVPAIFCGATAIVAKNNERTFREQLQEMIAEKPMEETEETEDSELPEVEIENNEE